MKTSSVTSAGATGAPTPMDLWLSSLTDPALEPGAAPAQEGKPSIDALMRRIEQLLPALLALMFPLNAGEPGADTGSGESNGVPAAAAPRAAAAGSGTGAASAAPPGADPVIAGPTTPAAEASTRSPATGAGVGVNGGGVQQAAAVNGVAPDAVQVAQTGVTGDRFYNVTNATTDRDQSFVYSVGGVAKGQITLKPGETGAFVADSADIGVRITPTTAAGTNSPNVVLYEDGGAGPGQAAGAGNPDISKVDGSLDAYGKKVNMTVTLSDGRMAGDGDAIHAYQFPTDDAASMGLAGDTSTTANIVLSDA